MKQNKREISQSGFAAIVIAVVVLLALVLVIAGIAVFSLNKSVSKINPSPTPVSLSQNKSEAPQEIQVCSNPDEPSDCNDELEGDNFVDDGQP